MFWTVSSDNLRKGDADVMKKKKILKIVLISIAVIVLLVLLAAAALFISFMHKYNSISYESVEIVSRTDSYIPPEPPDIVIDADGDPDTTESIHETESVTAESTEEASEHVPPETLPNEIYTPPANNGSNDTAPPVIYDPNKSFMDSDAVSVYGGTPIYKVNQKDPNVENILIVGTDARDVSIHRGLSDVMIVVSYNKSEGTIKLISFLRDSLVHIEGVGWGKLNWAYIRQGIGSTINTINQTFGLDIQRFIVIDFNGTKNFIDYIGGVDLYLSSAEASFYGVGNSAGTYHMNGQLALLHSRNRSLDSDFGRTRRQRDVVTAVINKMRSGFELSEVLGMMDHALKMVRTNIPFTSMVSLVSSVATGGALSIESHSVPFNDAYYYGWINGSDSVVCFDSYVTKNRIHDILY